MLYITENVRSYKASAPLIALLRGSAHCNLRRLEAVARVSSIEHKFSVEKIRTR